MATYNVTELLVLLVQRDIYFLLFTDTEMAEVEIIFPFVEEDESPLINKTKLMAVLMLTLFLRHLLAAASKGVDLGTSVAKAGILGREKLLHTTVFGDTFFLYRSPSLIHRVYLSIIVNIKS